MGPRHSGRHAEARHAAANCDVDADFPPAVAARPPRPRASDWILTGAALAPLLAVAYATLFSRFNRVRP